MQKHGESTVETVEKLVRPVLEELGFRLWDVRYEKEGPNWYLRIFIDRADGEIMDTDACETASRAVDPIVDEADPVEQSYFLEVGSPGLGRRLVRPEHFEAMCGRPVTARFIRAGEAGREISGTLERAADGWAVRREDGSYQLEKDNVAFVKLDDDIDL